MSFSTFPAARRDAIVTAAAPVVEIVVPVYNEAGDLAASVRRLHDHLTASFPFSWRVVIANNASTDATAAVAGALSADLPGVELLDLPEKGRGRALRTAWTASDADVLCYMDVDLSTDLNALLPLVAPLISGHSDLAIGTRLAKDSNVVRGPKREFISRTYNRILRMSLQARFSDAQCGFKAIRKDAAERLLPQVQDQAWFFDTELLVLAERDGLRIHEVPVDWTDDPESSVDIVRTATDDLKGVGRLLASAGSAPVRHFGAVAAGALTGAVALYLALQVVLGGTVAGLVSLAGAVAIGTLVSHAEARLTSPRRLGVASAPAARTALAAPPHRRRVGSLGH